MGCPMNFGEINIPSSRAFWDDDDEKDETEQQTFEKLELTYTDQTHKPSDTNILFLIEGTNVSEFATKTLLKGSVKVCSIPAKDSGLYILNKNVLLGILEEDLTSSGEITELLLPYAKQARQVITVTIKPKVDYKSENIALVRDEITFVRAINGELKQYKELKAPNFIAGVTAGVASWRENNKMQVSSYVAYTDRIPMDTLAAQPILQLLKELGIDCEPTFNPKITHNSLLYV